MHVVQSRGARCKRKLVVDPEAHAQALCLHLLRRLRLLCFFDLVDQRARLGGEGAVGFETEVFAEFNQRVGGAGDAQQQIAFQQVRAGETRIKRQRALHFFIAAPSRNRASTNFG